MPSRFLLGLTMYLEVLRNFSFSTNGREVTRYRRGLQEMPANVAAFAIRQGYATGEIPEPEPKTRRSLQGFSVDPGLAVGAKPSASPAVPALLQTMSQPSKRGGKKKKAAALLL